MKYLDARKEDGKAPKPSIIPDGENKMQSGNRRDQRNRLDPKDPQSLISSPNARTNTNTQTSRVQSLAKELGVDLTDVTKVKGTGPNGSVTEKDVREAHRAKQEEENKQQ